MMEEIKAKLPPRLDTQTKLSMSHFTIGKEPMWLKDVAEMYRTTFQSHYPPKCLAKVGVIKQPPTANIFQKDHDAGFEQCSVSHDQFVKKMVEKSAACKSLNKTNFKMDKDKRIETFRTTQEASYSFQNASPRTTCSNPTKSHIPDGDKEKEKWPTTHYTQNFPPKQIQDSSTRPHNHVSFTGIQGDVRSHNGTDMYVTSTNIMFPPRELIPKAIISESVKYPLTSIPNGDNHPMISTQASSFPERPLSFANHKPFNRPEALRQLQKTSVVAGDRRFDCFETTTNRYHSFPSKIKPDDLLKKRKEFHNSITVPPTKMISSTKSHYVAPPASYKNHLIDASKYHTASNVSLGNDKQKYYTTTIQEYFPQRERTYQKRCHKTFATNIPLKYYDKQFCQTSYNLNFSPNGPQQKLIPNQEALKNLQCSHIGYPLNGLKEFKTTHDNFFTPKQISLHPPICLGRLQKSSVPIGTLASHY